LLQALTAFGRAIRAHRRLARLAPRFFDSAVRDREAENRAERRRWMATWEPYIARAYGVEPRPPATDDELPPLPSVKIQREVDVKLAEREMCMVAGHAAMERWRQRQPHAVMSWSRMARLLKIGFDFGNLACGLESPNPLPEKIAYDYELTNLKRGYGHKLETPPVADAAGVSPFPNSDSGGAGGHSANVTTGGAGVPASRSESDGNAPSIPASGPGGCPQEPPASPPRCDAWSRWARQLRGRNR
jgi:hypothetical protein